MNLEFWSHIATILSLPISIIALIVGEQAIHKVNKKVGGNQNNEKTRPKIRKNRR